MRIKKQLSGVWMVWKIIVIVILSAILIPLAIANENEQLLLWIFAASLLSYIIVAAIGRKFRGMIGKYLLGTANRLLLAAMMLGATLLLFFYERESWARVTIIASAILYAFFLQRISFLRVIGL